MGQQEQLINANHHQQMRRNLNLNVTLHRPTPCRVDAALTPSANGLTPISMVPQAVTRMATDNGATSDGFNLGGGFTFNVEPSSTHFSRSQTSSVSASSVVFDPEQRYRGVDAEDMAY